MTAASRLPGVLGVGFRVTGEGSVEAMSVETLLLSIWEEEGFIGKTRVPIGASDIDALAVRARDRCVRVGESKVREGCRLVYPVDEYHVAEMDKAGRTFEWWLGNNWNKWMANLPILWDRKGAPAIAWLPPLSEVSTVDTVFLCNLWVFGDTTKANDALKRAVEARLRRNQAIATRIDAGDLTVSARVLATGKAVEELLRSVRLRINRDGYTRRFGDPIRDIAREINRYLHAEVKNVPCDASGNRVDTRKESSNAKVRRSTVLGILDALGVSETDLREMLEE